MNPSQFLPSTEVSMNFRKQVLQAFLRGRLWDTFPEEFREKPSESYDYIPNGMPGMPDYLRAHFKFDLLAEEGSTDPQFWSPVYRAFRELGWKRKSVLRDRGVYYILLYTFLPEDSQEPHNPIYLLLACYLPTCRLVQVGVKEVPVYETVCSDFQELPPDASPAEDHPVHPDNSLDS